MRSLKHLALVLSIAAGLGLPSAANAFSFSDWLRDFSTKVKTHKEPKSPPTHDRAVPEPTAALLFGLGAAAVAARTRKPR